MTCQEKTGRLNCGCCEDVALTCDREQGHDGPHSCVVEYVRYHGEPSKDLRIEWSAAIVREYAR